MYFCDDVFFPQRYDSLVSKHLSTAGTHAASQIFCSHIFLNYPSLLYYSSSMCTRKKVALQTNLIWTSQTYWKLLKQLLPIKRISRVLYSENYWRRQLRWWLIDILLSEHWNPSSVGDAPCPSWTSSFKCVCMKQISQNCFAFPEGSKVSKFPFPSGMPGGIRTSVSTQVNKIFKQGSQVCFQWRRTMQDISAYLWFSFATVSKFIERWQ